jgi:exopolyphosphatase/guanosine-5'-triphosphate,3'-diphosphate pyrophosphatase
VRVASIDIGTNSVLVLIAQAEPYGLAPLVDVSTITRLGEGVDGTGVLAAGAMDRTARCLSAYAETIASFDVTRIGAVATSAMRDAEGGEGFLDRVEEILGTRPEVISGEAEARLTFEGALVGLEMTGPVNVFDVGGGSTEIIAGGLGRDGGTAQVEQAVSLNVGAVRLTERHLSSDPPTRPQLDSLIRDARAVLATAPALSGRPLVGVGGTVTTLAAVVGAVEPYDSKLIHGVRLSRGDLAKTAERLATMPVEERKRLPGLNPKRADVIVAGTLLVEQLAAGAEASEIVVSDRGVRWGLAQKLARS